VLRDDQIVGTVERVSDGGRLSAADVDLLAELVAEVPTAHVAEFPDELLPRISVIVPTIYRRTDLLERTVRSVGACHYPNFEIVVVDNRRPGAHEAIPPFSDVPHVRIDVETATGASAARNRGIAASTGEVIAFTDDDAEVHPLWLRALGMAFALDPELDAAGGMVRPFELETRAQLWFEEFFGGFTKSFTPRSWSMSSVGHSDPLFPYSAGQFGAGCNMAVRRTALERVSGFDVRLGAGTLAKGAEDLEVFIAVLLTGGKVSYVPSALVRHSHRLTPDEFFTQSFGYGTGLTALYTALVFEDYRHAWRILRRMPRGARTFFFPKKPRSLSNPTSYPRRTALIHLAGMAYGPFAFARSARRARTERRHANREAGS